MSEPISLLDVIKMGGFDASLIATFNASLPFYEEVVLRRLVAAGCQQNIVLMDHAQCAVSWQSEATRPRLAGVAYSLVPIRVSGAFHPKVCILTGRKKATVLIGSHNLTLSGFGYNREITNWVHMSGRADSDGAALMDAVWKMVREWIELGRENLPPPLIEAVLSFSQSIAPLAVPGPATETVVLHQRPGGPSLINQVGSRVKGEVRRIGVTGAFFDRDLAFVDHLLQRWPQADVVVAIDPDTVHLPSTRELRARFVDARPLWAKSGNGANKYLHAKALYFEQTHEDGNVLVSGSANPSRPAWMGTQSSANVEAVILRTGPEAHAAAEVLGLCGMFALEQLSAAELEAAAARSVAELNAEETEEPFWIGVSISPNELEIARCGPGMKVDSACLLTDGQEVIQSNIDVLMTGAVLSVPVTVDIRLVRSCDLYFEGERVARAMIEHPRMLSAATKPALRQVRDALGALDPSGETISEMLKAVESAIFDAAAEEEVEHEVRSRRGSEHGGAAHGRPETLEISVSQLRQVRKRRRLVEAADIVTLIDLLTRRIGEELHTAQAMPLDGSGRSEEEQVNQDDDSDESGGAGSPNGKSQVDFQVQALQDAEIAKKVSKKIAKLIDRMLAKLGVADNPDTKARSLVQLVAVLSLVKELLRIERLARWRAAREFLVLADDRRRLLDGSVSCLFGFKTRFIEAVSDDAQEETEEAVQLRVLLLWLAWSLRDEVPERPVNPFDMGNQQEILRSKAIFLALAPPIAIDRRATDELRRYISATHRQNPSAAAYADRWMRRTIAFGELWSRELTAAPRIEVGGCCIVGDGRYPRLVVRMDDSFVGFWDYGEIRTFKTSVVIPVQPEASS